MEVLYLSFFFDELPVVELALPVLGGLGNSRAVCALDLEISSNGSSCFITLVVEFATGKFTFLFRDGSLLACYFLNRVLVLDEPETPAVLPVV